MAREAWICVMACQQYPNLRRGAKAGSICALIASTAWLAICYCVALVPAVSPASLSLAFRPWWRTRNWLSAFAVFVMVFLVAGMLVALRPVPGGTSHDGKRTA